MASLNLSINGPSIKSSYQGVVNGPPLSSSSSTYAQWALFSVQAPLANAFQDSGAKESVLKVQSTGEGELDELIEDFNEGRIQFAYVKVKDPNSGLPKNVLIAWCGGGVPERTKGYFTSHVNAVSKVLHGYHVQITARSDGDLNPESIMRKVSDASGAKYTAGGSAPFSSGGGPPPIAKKPVFTPTTSSSAVSPLVAARNRKQQNVDADGWGEDAPPVTRTEIQKVESAYKPTKVNMAELTKQSQDPPRFSSGGGSRPTEPSRDVIGGGYQPVGKVDIAAIRAAAKNKDDDRPTIVKGAYEPIGKVDIAAIRAKAQKPVEEDAPAPPKSLAERSAAFSKPIESERMTSMPKPKVANKFGAAATFTGTKAPLPGGLGFGGPKVPAAAPVGAASRTFADQGGKTPAQLWAEKHGNKSISPASTGSPAAADPIAAQKSGSEWKSGYSGKSWGTVQTPVYGRGGVQEDKTGEDAPVQADDAPASPSSGGGVSALRDRFKNAAPMGQAAPPVPGGRPDDEDEEEAAPPVPSTSRPSAGGFQLPGLPSRPPAPTDEEEDEEPIPEPEREREESPPRVAIPVPRGPEPKIEPAEPEPPRALPTRQIAAELPKDDPEEEDDAYDPRGAATAVAEQSFGKAPVAESQAASSGGQRALIQYDYEAAEDNEIELKEGEYVTEIEMVDEDWWLGTNSRGEKGLFPSNYVELVEDGAGGGGGASAVPPPPAPAAASAPEPQPAASQAQNTAASEAGATATAQFDYEAAEDNELSFPEGAKITDLQFPDEDWWFGHYRGNSGLFPANYVELDK